MQIALVSSAPTARLRYACEVVFGRILGLAYQVLTPDALDTIQADTRVVWYDTSSPTVEVAIHQKPHGLLFATGTASVTDLLALEKDPLAAIFWLCTHYAAYDAGHPKDVHGRALAASLPSFSDKNIPTCHKLAFEWVATWENPPHIPQKTVTHYPTFDIDNAYAYQAKGAWRWVGSLAKEVLAGGAKAVVRRLSHAIGLIDDPYDHHQLIASTLEGKPYHVFFLMSDKGRFDRAITPTHPDFKRLVRMYAEAGANIGLHPSYAGGQAKVTFEQERSLLTSFLGIPITDTRYHYLRCFVPQTYGLLVEEGIENDYSPGPLELGFWQGISTSIPWFDVEKDVQTPLELHPAAWMDVHHTQNPAAGLEHLAILQQNLASYGGRLVTIWHNDYFKKFSEARGFDVLF